VAKNTGKGHRKGAVKKRSEFYNPVTKQYSKRDRETGQILNNSSKPHKGVRDE